MAFKDIFEEQRKKLNNYFGLGQPGLGTFGKQVSNVIKPIVSKNIQNYQKAGRYLSSQPTLAQRFTPVVGPARSLVNLRRDLRNPQSLQRQAIAGAGKSVGDIANFAQKVNLPNQLANRLLPQKMTSQYNVGQFRNLIARQPQATTTAGKVARFGGEMLPYFAIPGGGSANYGSQAFRGLSKATPNVLTKATLTNAAKIAGRKELLANIGREAIQGAGFMGATSVGQDKSPKEIAKDILVGAGFGAGARLGMAGAGAVVGKVADKVKLQQAINSIKNPELRLQVNKEIGLLQSKPAFAKLPINPKKPSQPIVGANKGISATEPQKGIRLPLKGEKATEGLVTSVPPAGKGIERGFSKTIKTAQGLPDEIQNLKSTYIPITNKATLKAAKTQLDVEKFVKTNYDQAKKRVLSGEMTAENNALGQELIRRNIDAGKFDEVDEIFNKMAEKGTLAGQYNQAFAMWSKTTPEGMLKYAKSTVDKANSQLGSVSKALRGVFGKQMPKIDEADAKFITSQMKKAQGLPEAQRIPLIQSVMDRINKKIPWGVSDVIDTYRYNNMLSNPLTHLRNAVSNLQQTFITRPATLLGQGKVKDTVKYEIGTLKALPDAVDGFVKAMKKPGQLGRLDEPMRLKPRLLGRWNIPSDLMEAGDVFFRKLIESGEKSRGTTAKEASEIAEYSLFRAPLNAKQQGVLLNKIDDVTKATYNLRKVGLGWFIPFIRTPMNVAKQWIEYSPAGFSTMVGAGNKGEQAAKATIGSLITLAGANLALQGRTTWDAPVDPKEKELFYASGRKPFSVKVGDKWVPMQTFGAFAFALGLPAAAKYYQTESRTALTDDDISKWTKIATSGLNFWSGQTFVQGLGNFVDLVQGDQDWKLSRLLAQPITQLKPMTGALSYIARLTDPVFRKASGFGDQLKQGVPGLTKGMKAYTNPLGEESRRNITDFVAPYSMGQEDTRFEQPYKERQKTLQENNLINQLKKQGKSGTAPSGRTVVQIGNEFKEFDTEQEANFAIAKEDFKKSGKNIQQYEDKVFRLQSDGDVKVQDKIDYDYSLNTNKLQRLKSSKDYKGWVETANKQLEILDKQLKDPTLDELEQSDLLEKADKILSDMAKYSEYGGFDKPKKGKKINISVPDLGSAKIPVKRAGKFAFKTSSTPKINIVSTKPKQITKSYLASIR